MSSKDSRVAYTKKVTSRLYPKSRTTSGFMDEMEYGNAVRQCAKENDITQAELEEFFRTGKRPKK